MNPTLAPLFARRSIRRYTDRPMPDGVLHDLLEAAMAAPSAVAKDPWHFVVARDRTTLDRMADGLLNGQMLREAATGILVSGDLARAHGESESYLLQKTMKISEKLAQTI
jgi:nitroreductase